MLYSKYFNKKLYEALVTPENEGIKFSEMVYVNISNEFDSRYNREQYGEYLTRTAALIILEETVKAYAPVDATYYPTEFDPEIFDSLTIEVERGWGVGGTLYIRLDHNHDLVQEDKNQKIIDINYYSLKFDLSWSSTSRSIEQAQASIDIYQELVTTARKIETVFQGMKIYRKHEVHTVK